MVSLFSTLDCPRSMEQDLSVRSDSFLFWREAWLQLYRLLLLASQSKLLALASGLAISALTYLMSINKYEDNLIVEVIS